MLVLVLVAVWALPALDGAVSREDLAEPGDVIQLDDVITFAPEPGWNVVSGERQGSPGSGGRYAPAAAVSKDGVVLQIQTDTYDGTADGLLEQLRTTSGGLRGEAGYRVIGDPIDIATAAGDRGVAARFSGSSGNGLIGAFVFGDHGVRLVAVGPATTPPAVTEEVGAMIRSVAPVGTTSEATS
ncbi:MULTISPECIES: hypothetical protein [unclassified Isoptericola]|uniref:hypothetical protein n=1 Tax=unclassified Isoptericola TaxID=2623355 RepID=UPI003660378D